MKLTYFHTLYQREVTDIVLGEIEFKDGKIYYYSGGHGYAIALEYVRKIEPLGGLE